MSLSQTTKFKIVRLLGYPTGVIIVGNIDYQKQVVDRLNALPVELEPDVMALLTRIDSLDLKLDASLARAGVKRIDDIEFDGTSMSSLRGERLRLLRELAGFFGLMVMVGGGAGSMGDVCLG